MAYLWDHVKNYVAQKQGCRGLRYCPESSKENSTGIKMNRKMALAKSL